MSEIAVDPSTSAGNHNDFFCSVPLKAPYKCPMCDFQTHTKKSLRNHISWQSVLSEPLTNRNICKKCDFTSYSRLIYTKHTLRCTQIFRKSARKKLWSCETCLYTSSRIPHIKDHMMAKHTPHKYIEWFTCHLCDYKTNYKRYLQKHVLKKHTSKENMVYVCVECSYKTKWKGNLKSHTLRVHTPDDNINWLECDQCESKFKEKSMLKRHQLRRHKDQEVVIRFGDWGCTECTFRTTSKTLLEKHCVARHGKENLKRFQCDQCSLVARDVSQLKKHVEVKHKGSLHACKVCMYMTKRKGD